MACTSAGKLQGMQARRSRACDQGRCRCGGVASATRPSPLPVDDASSAGPSEREPLRSMRPPSACSSPPAAAPGRRRAVMHTL